MNNVLIAGGKFNGEKLKKKGRKEKETERKRKERG